MKIAIIVMVLSVSCTTAKLTKEVKKEDYKQLSQEEATQEPEFGLVLVGDTGTGDKVQYQVARAIGQFCASNKCSAGLLLGDNFYPKGVKDVNDPQFKTKFEDVYKDLKFKFYISVGNHDKYGNKQAEVDYKSDHWEAGGLFYSIDAAWIDIFALDTNINGFPAPFKGREQRAWLSEFLKKSTSQWKIVFGHHPVYSSGVHGNTLILGHYIKPMLKENNVDFYISGHDHDKELIERDGTKFIVSGAGSKTRPVGKGKYTVFSKSSLGFAHLLLSPTRAIVKFVDSKGDVEFERAYMKTANATPKN